eukprot:tig00001038_g6527.t1
MQRPSPGGTPQSAPKRPGGAVAREIRSPATPSGAAGSPGTPGSAYGSRNREYLLLIEYKHLRTHCSGGVYVLPSNDSILRWDGVLFIRDGPYRGGIFRFVINIPEAYPDVRPHARFTTKVFHPRVAPNGDVDLSHEFPSWTRNNSMAQLLEVLKKLFQPPLRLEGAINREAAELYSGDAEGFAARVEACVLNSQTGALANEGHSSVKFSEFRPEHEELLAKVLASDQGVPSEGAQEGFRFFSWFQNLTKGK